MLRRLLIENLVLIDRVELELAPGLNAITGETGAGKTILAQALGLLLGQKADAGWVRPHTSEAYVEAEFEAEQGIFQDEAFETLLELRPPDEEGIVLARRVFGDGRTRAYAWGRAAAREDVAALGDRLLSMSGQFEQRRLARPSYQLDVLDAFVGAEQRRRRADARLAWRELVTAARRHRDLTSDAAAAEARLAELRALVEDTGGLEAGAEEALRSERERLRHTVELVEGADIAVEALSPEDGEGAAGLVSRAERAIAPLERIAPELSTAGEDLREVELRLRETVSALRSFATSLEAEPGRLEEVEAELDRIAGLKRRYGAVALEDLVARAREAAAELAAIDDGVDPVQAASEALTDAERRVRALSEDLRAARRSAAVPFSDAVGEHLRTVGVGEGELLVELREREPGPAGMDEVSFLIKPNPGMPFSPVAETASGGELSRIALAIAAVSGGETMVFDEIDAGIGGRTAHGVGELLQRLSEHGQVIVITHLPQIASLADRHFLVEKTAGDPTRTRIEPLGDAARREELQRMLGGQEFLSTVAG